MVECTAFTVICRCHKPGNAESVQNHNQFHKSCIIKKPTVALFHLKNSSSVIHCIKRLEKCRCERPHARPTQRQQIMSEAGHVLMSNTRNPMSCELSLWRRKDQVAREPLAIMVYAWLRFCFTPQTLQHIHAYQRVCIHLLGGKSIRVACTYSKQVYKMKGSPRTPRLHSANYSNARWQLPSASLYAQKSCF